MNCVIYFIFICILFNCIKIHSQPVNLDYEEWETGYHPFPEMSRFLNSHPRIHQPSAPSSYPLLGYICSIADNKEKIEEVLQKFGKKYRSLIMMIIEQDCSNYTQQHKRTTISMNRKYFPRQFLRNIINDDDDYKI